MLDQFLTYLTYVSLVFLGFIIIYFMFSTKKKREKKRENFDIGTKSLFNALDSLIYEDYIRAIKYLKESAIYFSEEIMIHNLIAEILRKKNPKKALEIHKSLLFKHNIKNFEKNATYFSIAKDFNSIGELKKALYSLEKISKEYHTKSSLNLMITIEKELGLFDKIYEHQKLLNKILKTEKENDFDKISLEITNYYLQKNDKDKFKKSLDNLKKYWKNHYIYLFALIISDMMSGKKIVKKAQNFIKIFPEQEILLRFLLYKRNKLEENNTIEGDFQKIFSFLFEKNIKLSESDFDFLDKNLFLFEYLKLATQKNNSEKLLEYLLNNKIFESQTHNPIKKLTLIDENSQPIKITLVKLNGDF